METDVHKIVNGLVEITLPQEDNFLKVKETLTRIGIANNEKKLYQSCHILHKKRIGKYFIVHFKELYMLDGKPTNFDEDDKARRNTIANLMEEWGLVEIVDKEKTKEPVATLNRIKILPFAEKGEWQLLPKYRIGNKRKVVDVETNS